MKNIDKLTMLKCKIMLEQIFSLTKFWHIFLISTQESFSLYEILTIKEENSVGRTWLILFILTTLCTSFKISDIWFTSYQRDRYKQFTYLILAFQLSNDLFEMYPDVLFDHCTDKTIKYNIPLCNFTAVAVCKKCFYMSSFFFGIWIKTYNIRLRPR